MSLQTEIQQMFFEALDKTQAATLAAHSDEGHDLSGAEAAELNLAWMHALMSACLRLAEEVDQLKAGDAEGQ